MSQYTEQAESFLAKHGLKFRATFKAYDKFFPDDKTGRNIYTCTISGKGRGRVSFKFGQSLQDTETDTPPVAYDLLACLTKYEVGTFENFCSEYGYDTDSRQAEKTYHSVVREWRKVSNFFTAGELAELQEIS